LQSLLTKLQYFLRKSAESEVHAQMQLDRAALFHYNGMQQESPAFYQESLYIGFKPGGNQHE